MKIDTLSPLLRPGQAEQRSETHKSQETTTPRPSDGGPAAVTHLSRAASDPGQDIDVTRVAELRDAIREGRLEIHAERIADGLIASVQELLDGGDDPA